VHGPRGLEYDLGHDVRVRDHRQVPSPDPGDVARGAAAGEDRL